MNKKSRLFKIIARTNRCKQKLSRARTVRDIVTGDSHSRKTGER